MSSDSDSDSRDSDYTGRNFRVFVFFLSLVEAELAEFFVTNLTQNDRMTSRTEVLQHAYDVYYFYLQK